MPNVDYSPCRTCHRQVRWVKTAKTGKPMPLDEDSKRGNVVIDCNSRAHVFRDRETALAAVQANFALFGVTDTTYISHHAEGQCNRGADWRGKTRRDADAPQGTLLAV